MSSVASSSVGNMPPRHGKKLAEVSIAEAMDGAMKANHKRVEEAEDEKSELGELTPPPPSQEIPPSNKAQQTETKQVQSYTMTTSVYPPQPCERCVRSKKTCKGIAGARCEHCKSLHQKCSNSTGPPRGRHATANQPGSENGKGTTLARPKRKAMNDKGKPSDEDDEEEHGEEEEDGKGQPLRKKRRPANERRTRLLKEVIEVETAIKKLQTAYTKDFAKLGQTVASLMSQIREMD